MSRLCVFPIQFVLVLAAHAGSVSVRFPTALEELVQVTPMIRGFMVRSSSSVLPTSSFVLRTRNFSSNFSSASRPSHGTVRFRHFRHFLDSCILQKGTAKRHARDNCQHGHHEIRRKFQERAQFITHVVQRSSQFQLGFKENAQHRFESSILVRDCQI